jgi:hypothetical protein
MKEEVEAETELVVHIQGSMGDMVARFLSI